MNRVSALLAGAVSVLALLVWFGFSVRHSAKTANDSVAPAAPHVKTTIARFGEYLDRVTVAGRVGAPAGSSAKIAFAQPGIVASVDVRVGDTVSAGQTLARLDRAALAAALAQAQADARTASSSYGGGSVPSAGRSGAAARLAVAQAKLSTLRQGGPAALSSRIAAESGARQIAIKVTSDQGAIDRDVQLLAAGVIAQKELDGARAQLASDQADQRALDAKVSAANSDFQAAVKQAEADVASARNDLTNAQAQRGVLGGQAASAQAKLDAARIAYGNGVLAAPAGGVVLAIMKHPGEAVDPASSVMEIGPSFGHAVTLTVPGDTALRIKAGDSVTLKMQNSSGARAKAIVEAVVPAVDATTQLATVVVRGSIPNAVPGDAVSAVITIGRLRGILVPSTAIVQDPQTGATAVFVRRATPKAGESAFEQREVAVRASDTLTAVLTSGLKAGETIAAQGGYALLAPAGG